VRKIFAGAPTSARGLGSLTPSTAAPGTRSAGQALPSLESGLGSPRPHLHRDWAHPAHICTGTCFVRASAAPLQASSRWSAWSGRPRQIFTCRSSTRWSATSASSSMRRPRRCSHENRRVVTSGTQGTLWSTVPLHCGDRASQGRRPLRSSAGSSSWYLGKRKQHSLPVGSASRGTACAAFQRPELRRPALHDRRASAYQRQPQLWGPTRLIRPGNPGPRQGRGPGVRDGAPKTAADQTRGAWGGGGPEDPPGRPAGQRGATSSRPPRGRAANDSAPTPPVRTGRART
jgi:hypothetical protein